MALCVEREAWEGGVLVEPGAVGTVLGPAKEEDRDGLVEFPHMELDCYHCQLRLHPVLELLRWADARASGLVA